MKKLLGQIFPAYKRYRIRGLMLRIAEQKEMLELLIHDFNNFGRTEHAVIRQMIGAEHPGYIPREEARIILQEMTVEQSNHLHKLENKLSAIAGTIHYFRQPTQ